jgi:elongation factor G
VDFTIEVERCLRVLDSAVGIFCAVSGVEPQSETVWRQADRFGIPRLAVVNKMDRPGASFSGVLGALRERLGERPVALTIPLGEEERFCGVLDLVRGERLIFDQASKGRKVKRSPFVAEDAALAAPWRDALLDVLTEEDDSLLEVCLSGGAPTPGMLDAALRKAVLARRCVPVFAASALRNIGVQPVLDAICRYLPSPLDLPPALAREETGELVPVPADPHSPACALAFKVMMADGRKLAFTRLYAGIIREGDSLLNSRQGISERVTRLYRLHAGQKEQLTQASTGDIVALQGLKKVFTGDTLVGGGKRLLLEDIRSLRPVIALAFEPKNAEEGERLDDALACLALEDPTLHVEMNEATGHRVVSGMGELHLEVLRDRMRREYGVNPRVGNPQVLCRETLASAGEGSAVFDRELGGQPHYGRVSLVVRPTARRSGLAVHLDIELERCPRLWAEAVEQGILDACGCGPGGCPLEDIEVRVTAAEGLAGPPTPVGLRMAAQAALRQALEMGGRLLLEPLMQVEISVPEAYLGNVLSLLGSRGAKVDQVDERAGLKRICALAPIRVLFGFSTALRSASQGRAGLTMRFDRFDAL